MKSLGRLTIFLVASCLALQVKYVYSGPMKRSSRMIREVYPEIEPEKEGNLAQVCIVGDVVYEVDEPVPAEQPCLKCKCQPPGVQCETIQCLKKPGCRAIHKPNKCCPDYQCECEYEGRTYANGERLETTPGGECKVCYCRGGEVQCAEVSCYIRTDCEGRRVSGQCCPRYDRCPPKEPSYKNSDATEASNGQEKKPYVHWLTTELFTKTSVSPNYDNQNENSIQENNEEETNDNKPEITIQEIIPEIKEIPMTEKPKIKQPIIISESLKNVDDFVNRNKEEFEDTDADSSEVTQTYHHPPPVLKIGDKLLFLKKGELVDEKDTSSPPSVITIIGAEGLQRGFEDSGELHEIPVNSTKEGTTHIISLVKQNRKKNDELETSSAATESSTGSTATVDDLTDFDTENSSASYTEEITTVSPDVGFETVSEIYTENSSTYEETTDSSSIAFTTEIFENRTESLENDTLVNEMSNLTTEVNVYDINPTTEDQVKEVIEENPAYPPIPDIMSPQEERAETEIIQTIHDLKITTESSNQNTTTIDSKILPDILDIRDNKTIPENMTHSEWLKDEPSKNQTSSLVNVKALLPEEIIKEYVPSDFEDITEIAESTTTEESTTINYETTTIREDTKEMVEIIFDESGEATTKPNSHASIMSNENASVDIPSNESPEQETAELVEIVAKKDGLENLQDDVELKDLPKPKKSSNSSTDVEMFDPEIFKRAISTNTKSVPKKNGKVPERLILKRENSEDQSVFHQLDKELDDSSTQRVLSKLEEEKEAQDIFKELLEETSTTKEPKTETVSPQPRNKETQVLERVSNAIAKFQLRDTKQSLDSNILGILRDFFSSQYRS